ncbi:flagellar hook-length control protein FliK [Ramlibacter sp. RBP-2]|uniref:Flagellar hook-length control protein FliK n=1 Tax=Ramlibacter lithotrophicus TaxID=2606681 RepID=A0A7X6I6A2_9BURK|nr:flagellar hook-length control protein FliK [Ramlibacter lithotrophicus]NKE66156.1 flagellar hook-length control protein FliK [Ramlibacter lithotrophicus]
MTPAVLQALSIAAPAASARQAAAATPGDGPASFADTLDASVDALSEDGELQSAAAPDALASELPRLDAMAMMLAAALPATDAGRRAAPGDGQASLAALLDVPRQAPTGPGEHAAREADEPQGGAAPEALATGQARFDALALMLAATPAVPGQGAPMPATTLPGAGPRALPVDPRPGLDAPAAALAVPHAAAAPAGLPPPPAARVQAAPEPGIPAPQGQWRQLPATSAATSEATPDVGVVALPPPAATVAAAAAATATAPAVAASATARNVAAPAAASVSSPAAPPRAPIELQGDPAAPSAALASDVELAAAPEAAPAPPQLPPATGLPAPTVASAPAGPATVAHLAPPVGAPDWAPALAQQIVRLPAGGEVELHLNPAELGPLHVKLSLVESQAQVLFVTEHAAVRHALEAALPQLRTGLAESGINLGQATVGSGAGEQRTGQDGGERPARGEQAAPRDERGPAKPHGGAVRGGRAGAVDTFA